jgi:hypothetical protein
MKHLTSSPPLRYYGCESRDHTGTNGHTLYYLDRYQSARMSTALKVVRLPIGPYGMHKQ